MWYNYADLGEKSDYPHNQLILREISNYHCRGSAREIICLKNQAFADMISLQKGGEKGPMLFFGKRSAERATKLCDFSTYLETADQTDLIYEGIAMGPTYLRTFPVPLQSTKPT